MVQKKALNLSVSVDLLREFEAVCSHYGHAKQKGMVLSAAILMFLRSNPTEQGDCLVEVATAEITSGVDAMIERARSEQARRVAAQQDQPQRKDARDRATSDLRIAAKKADTAVHSLKNLPQQRKAQPGPDQ